MAAPIDSAVILPDDSGNSAGKKIRSQTRVVGANTVHEHFVVPISARKLLGCYQVNLGAQAVLATAHTPTSTAFVYFTMPVAATTVGCRVRRIEHSISIGAVANATNAIIPARVSASRITMTGTNSAALTTPMKRKTTDATNTTLSALLLTGYTVTLGAVGWTWMIPAVLSTGAPTTAETVCWANPCWDPNNEDEFIDLQAGEGLVIYQADNGATSDVRKICTTIIWDEYDLA
jgi:hypothetical protein